MGVSCINEDDKLNLSPFLLLGFTQKPNDYLTGCVGHKVFLIWAFIQHFLQSSFIKKNTFYREKKQNPFDVA